MLEFNTAVLSTSFVTNTDLLLTRTKESNREVPISKLSVYTNKHTYLH